METKNRIRELRKSMNLSQETLAAILGTSQQAVSRMENGAYDIPTDLLVKMADSFNVTTDYILGRTDIKRDLSGQVRMNHEMDRYYDIVLRYQRLTDINKKTLMTMLERLEQAQGEQEKLVTGNLHRKENDVDDEDSGM
ncbi:helix-turn-helix transcriptional regulator [Lachnospiraceae bacterium 54-11]|jgi:transcriptional regulator with XRE-family HTH domain|nr:XRE family transcriptional regulator [Lachnospiraceae bacterium]